MYKETHLRHMVKSVSYRLFGSGATAASVFFLTRRVDLAAAVGGIDIALKVTLFFVHERIWERIRFGRKRVKPYVVWLTGLSGSGKTTLADRVAERLRASGLMVETLDGDKVRALFPATGFTREERNEHLRRVGALAAYLERSGVVVVAAFISPYEETRAEIRKLCGRFIEIHVATPLAECERRDVKGLYARARRGEIQNFTGINDPYEEPRSPDLRIDTTNRTVDQSVDEILKHLDQRMEAQWTT